MTLQEPSSAATFGNSEYSMPSTFPDTGISPNTSIFDSLMGNMENINWVRNLLPAHQQSVCVNLLGRLRGTSNLISRMGKKIYSISRMAATA